MKILFLGGTSFLGRHMVEAATASRHDVTIFTRGKTNPDLFPGVERLRGDRDGDLGALEGRRWDAVVDTSGYRPRVVRASAHMLAGSVGHYTFVSSVSVYADSSRPDADESAPVGTLEDETVEEITGETYGPLKALCERAVEEELPGRALIVRPGLIVGPHDPTDRFTYWPRRIARGGDVLVPGTPDRVVQFIDVRDLAAWMLRCVEGGTTGVFNATGPERPLPMGEFLQACDAAVGGGSRLVWVDDKFLLDRDVAPWSDVPMWLPGTDEYAGFHAIDCSRAIAKGLTFRPAGEIAADTLAWDRTREPGTRAGIDEERERALLAEWAQGGA